jgi:hypothetical protein
MRSKSKKCVLLHRFALLVCDQALRQSKIQNGMRTGFCIAKTAPRYAKIKFSLDLP